MRKTLIALIATPVAALTLAGALNLVLGWGLAVPEAAAVVMATAEPTPASNERARSKRQYLTGILDRNIFDHTAIGRTSGPSGPAAPSDLQLRLIGTMVAQPAIYSSAMISRAEGLALGYGAGDTIDGTDAVIERIDDKTVTVRRANGDTQVLTLGEGERPAVADSAPSSPTRPSSESSGVSRETIEKLASDPASLAQLGNARPHKDASGAVDGYTLTRIRGGTLPHDLGLRNGDVVHSVNGYPLTSVQDAMKAWTSLQDADGFQAEISRRGQTVTLDVPVH